MGPHLLKQLGPSFASTAFSSRAGWPPFVRSFRGLCCSNKSKVRIVKVVEPIFAAPINTRACVLLATLFPGQLRARRCWMLVLSYSALLLTSSP